ncbi:MAG: tungsten formylmethanofuran dehydrogenase [Kouleothrix sp.]|jgi:citrate synthase|nr:tungsten formylmethanofuran dehydrogenase [Kouleothrix sp.]
MATEAPLRGLENVVVASTRLSAIDGTAGRLSYAGFDIHDLAERACFEEVVFLLWYGELPRAAELHDFSARLVAARQLGTAELALVRSLPASGHGMDALRTLVSGLALLDAHADDTSAAGAERIGVRIVAQMPVLIAAWDRLRRGLDPVAPDPALPHAANFLYMLRGVAPGAAEARAFEGYMVLLAEHGLNASTFAARVAIGSQADVYCAVVAAIGTLKGLLHGGANQKAMEAFLAIGMPERAGEYIEQLLARQGRLMGVGHRIYKVEDPRVRHLRRYVQQLAQGGASNWQEVADAVARVVAEHPHFTRRQLNPNVEFYSAPLLYMLDLPLDLFTAAFALSRVAGWVGHIAEQLADNRLIRPKADYHGPARRGYVALDQRG